MSEDIKQAFDSVFTDEPPLRLRTDEVLGKGQGLVRRRRATIAGGVAMAVTAVVVGSSLVFGAPTADQANPSPTCVVEEPGLPTLAVSPPQPCVLTTEEHARELTAVLADGDVVPAGFTLQKVREQFYVYPDGRPLYGEPLVFRRDRVQYMADADLVNADERRGRLTVWVGESTARGPFVDCGGSSLSTCETRTVNGEEMQIITTPPYASSPGTTIAINLKRADGTEVHAWSTNGLGLGVPSVLDAPPLSVEQLVKVVTLPGLKF